MTIEIVNANIGLKNLTDIQEKGGQNMKYDMLKGKIVEKKKNYKECAKALNISKTSFSCKINGITKFYVDEAVALSDFLELNLDERLKIFLS